MSLDLKILYSQWRALPNVISLFRILLIIPIVILYPVEEYKWVALTLICIAFISDGLDGWIARKFDKKTDLGLILDPLADKIWTFTLIVLIILFRELPILLGMIIIGRDVIILGMNAYIVQHGGRLLASSFLGKTYMALTGVMIIGYTLHISESIFLGYALAILTPVILVDYYLRIKKSIDLNETT